MPIRTNTGHNAVLRAIGAWLFDSWRHLALAILTLAAIGIGWATLAGNNSHHTQPQAVAATASETTSTTETSPATSSTSSSSAPASSPASGSVETVPSVPLPPATTTKPVGNPLTVATKFMTIWVQNKLPQAKWLAELKPLATPEYGADQLTTVDPANIPASKVTGPAVLTHTTGRGADVTVPTDTMKIALHLQDQTGKGNWLVSDVEQASH